MIKKKQFFADNRAVIEGIGKETRYFIDGKQVEYKRFSKFIKGETLKDGTNRHKPLSKKAQGKLDLEEMRYVLADAKGEVDHIDPTERAVEELRTKVASDTILRKRLKVIEDAHNAESKRLREERRELKLWMMDEKIKLLEEEHTALLQNEKRG